MTNRRWHWIDWVLFITTALFYITGILFFFFHPDATNAPKILLTIALLASFLVPMLFWRPNYTNATYFTIAHLILTGFVNIYLSYTLHEVFNIVTLPMIIVAFLSSGKSYYWTWPSFTFIFMLPFFLIEKIVLFDLINAFISSLMFFGFGLSLNRIFESHERMKRLLNVNQTQYQMIQQQNKVLEQYSQHVEQITLLEERNRMAREMHDTVGHTFTSVIMGMDAVSYLIDSAPQRALEKLDVLRNVTRNGLEEIRRYIHQISPNESDDLLSQQLTRLTNEFAVHTGTVITMMTEGTEYTIPMQIKLTLIRCLQECLTNAKRHGQAMTIKVILLFAKEQITLSIEDDGIGAEPVVEGFGLQAMRERLFVLHGMLQVNSEPGTGTKVICAVPIRGENE
jgi:signal transduction histidine kinase